jgi:hypothetical protein
MDVNSSYYFRAVHESFDEDIIKEIAGMGHEIGYHYEDFAACQGDIHKAARQFKRHLAYFRQFYPVQTACMHGSPLSRINNLDLWQTHDYKALGIVGEPYMDVDFGKVFYLTDTGRRWNHAGVSNRDRVDSGFDIQVKSTGHLMALAREGRLPERMMINTHPQRWEDRVGHWVKGLVWQNVKNVGKRVLMSGER